MGWVLDSNSGPQLPPAGKSQGPDSFRQGGSGAPIGSWGPVGGLDSSGGLGANRRGSRLGWEMPRRVMSRARGGVLTNVEVKDLKV